MHHHEHDDTIACRYVSVHHAIAAHDYLAMAPTLSLRHGPSAVGESLEAISGSLNPLNHPIRMPGRVLCDVLMDLPQIVQRPG
jgi:hypothetical protein